MKPGGQLKRTPMKPGSKSLARSAFKRKTPMARGDKQMERQAKPMKAIGARAKRTGQGKVAPTAAERAWMDAAQAFGCIVCWAQFGLKVPCSVHHIIEGGRRKGHLFTIGLCENGHHQNSTSVDKISRHPWKKRFEMAYGTEMELRDLLIKQIGWKE